MASKGTIYSIGHSNHPPERFFSLIKQAKIDGIVDVRSIPASSRFPHFSKKKLERICNAWDVEYMWLNELGGKGKGIQENVTTEGGQKQFQQLMELAYQQDSDGNQGYSKCWAMMCSEHDWRECHRKFLSDYLVDNGLDVIHIMVDGTLEKHDTTD